MSPGTDMDTAKAVYKLAKAKGLDYCVQVMMAAGLTKTTATTYFNKLRREDTQLTLRSKSRKL